MTTTVAREFRRLRHLLGIDRAVGFTVLARSWTILSGALTVLLIVRFLSSAEQGYYYTFASLVAIQVVFELGFSFVVLQLAAHESSQLHVRPDGEVLGSKVAYSRLASILQKSVRWYSVAAVLMATVLMIAGIHFFSAHGKSSSPIAWKTPWICLVLAAIFTFQMDPIFSFLEGCGFVPQVARLRLAQAITGTTLAWMALTHHHGLFAPAAVIFGQAVAGLAFLISKRQFLLPLLLHNSGNHIVSWRTEIWPFQWRMAVSYFCGYFIVPLFNPLLFAYRGPVEAGKMGMSCTVAGALGTVALAWMNTKASPFGKMIASRDFGTLDRVFFRTLVQSAALLVTAEVVILGAFFVAERDFPKLASRMLPAPAFTLILFTIFLTHLQFSQALYLRAHMREPLLFLNIGVALLAFVSTVVTSRLWGATGVATGFFVCEGVINLAGGTYIFLKCRREWHCVK